MSNEPVPLYSQAERDRRWTLARTVMDQEGVDAMIVFGEHEDSGPAAFAWDTRFTNGRPGSTIIFPKLGTPIELIPFHLFVLDHSMAKTQNNPFWIPTENLRLGRNSSTIAETLIELGLEKSKIGVVGLDAAPPWHMEGIVPYQLWQSVLGSFPDATFTSVSDRFARMAMVLSEEELKMVRHASRIGEEMAEPVVNSAKVGSKETELYHAASAVAHRNGTVALGMHLLQYLIYSAQPPEIE